MVAGQPHAPWSPMAYNQRVDSPCGRRVRHAKGSRRGYYADIDDLPTSGDEDEASAVASATESVGRVRFYSHVRPRRRDRNKLRRGNHRPDPAASRTQHPDIDLSLVSLLSSREFDRRFGVHHDDSPIETSLAASLQCETSNISSTSNYSSSDSRGNPLNNEVVKNETRCGRLASPRPLAVVDYGSIELDMSGSLLDSIYKIGGSRSRRTGDLQFGGRRFTLDDKPNMNNDSHVNRSLLDSIYKIDSGGRTNDLQFGGGRFSYDGEPNGKHSSRNDKAAGSRYKRIDKIAGMTVGETAFTVASSRSSEVRAVIASLKNVPSAKRMQTSRSSEGQERKRLRTAKAPASKRVDQSPTSLEDAISFSPFARVLFCAHAPHTIVHSNAAYSALVQKGIATACAVGESFASGERRVVENLEEYIARIVAEHAGKIEDNRNGREIKLFPIFSDGETCNQFIHHDGKNNVGSASTRMNQEAVNSNGRIQYISHYLLQIEPDYLQLC